MEGKDKENKHKHRLKGLFSKEKKVSSSEDDVDDFLRGSDKLNFPAPTPTSPQLPRLSRLDTKSASRWPSATEIQNAKLGQGRSASPKRHRKGLVVRFTDERPEIIGEGGDEAELPTAEIAISSRNRAHSRLPNRGEAFEDRKDIRLFVPQESFEEDVRNADNVRPGPLRRTQTGFESVSESTKSVLESFNNEQLQIGSHDPKSFAARIKAEMQAGEGKALVQGASGSIEQQFSSTGSPKSDMGETNPKIEELQRNTLENTHILPPGLPSQLIPGRPSTPKPSHQSFSNQGNRADPNSRSETFTTPLDSPVALSQISTSNTMADSPESLSKSSTLTIHRTTLALGDDAFQEFSSRVAHLFTLFRLSAESTKPLSTYSLEDFTRAALWWFLHGRLNLEAITRDRPSTPEVLKDGFSVRQQAFADLAKSLWLVEKAIPQYNELPNEHNTRDPMITDFLEIRKGIISSLRKLTMSMKRNNFLPPEDAPLPQGLDSSIWIQENGNRSLLGSQKEDALMKISALMPLGDSNQTFQYGRLFAKGILKEGSDSQEYRSPVLATLVRNHQERTLSLIVTNQNGTLKICIQADKAHGPTWEDVDWHVKTSTINVRLPRGFTLQLQCALHDFKVFLAMHDYQKKLYSDFKQKQDERILFDSTIRTFQYFDQEEKSTFPKEPISLCQLRIFEKAAVEKTATGTRNLHRGFRTCLVTSPTVKILRGINQDIPPDLPIQFGFLRGESGLPAFLLKIDNGQRKYTMVFTFEDPRERSLLHTRLTGASLLGGEAIVVETEMKSFNIANLKAENPEFKCLKGLDWQSVRVINEDQEDPKTSRNFFSENLRVVMDFKIGSLTDRFNVGPGELKLRLDVTSSNELKILRQQQQDMTVSLLESQVSKELPKEFAELLRTISQTETTRTYTFPSLKDLHLFQTALTGFSVIFDGKAVSFNISRRRMVVPIYKKWDAVTTRLQLVQREKIVQLVAFFENFSHGDCMNFTLKSTEIFETSSKGGKFSLRIVDAKFALPKGHGDYEAGLDRGFVCLDMPEYPGEHDDITIVFDNELERERFVKCLPAPVRAASRMASVRR